MYKVLLADDEVLDLEGMLAFIPWPELGLEVAGAASSGFAACEVLEREAVDILVTDIRMPNMSGIELAKRAREKRRDVRVIFVSGHRDFQYAKQAMELHAHGYVLKPMDDKELVEALRGVIDDLDADRRQREREETFRQLVPIARNEYLLRLLENAPDAAADEGALSGACRLDGLRWPARVALVEIDDYSWKLNPYAEPERKRLLGRYRETLSGFLRERGIGDCCRIGEHRVALLLGADAGNESIEPLIRRIAEAYPFTITAGIGRAAGNPSELHVSYREAALALDRKMLRGKSRLIVYEEEPGEDAANLHGLDERLEALLRAMAGYDLVGIHDGLSDVFAMASRFGSKLTIQRFAMYAVMKLSEFMRGMGEDLYQLLGLEFRNLDRMLQFETIAEIESWLRGKAFELSETLHGKRQSKNAKLVQEVVAFVRERLHESVTLREAAERFSFSPNHLGVLFKEETGSNFSDYVIQLRMETAQRLLADTRLKIYEVADRVGYRYLPYFSRQFKETTGMTPLEYRRSR